MTFEKKEQIKSYKYTQIKKNVYSIYIKRLALLQIAYDTCFAFSGAKKVENPCSWQRLTCLNDVLYHKQQSQRQFPTTIANTVKHAANQTHDCFLHKNILSLPPKMA